MSRDTYQVTVARYGDDGARIEVDSILIPAHELEMARDWTEVVRNKAVAMFRLLGMGVE